MRGGPIRRMWCGVEKILKFLYKILIVPIIGVIKNKRRKGHDTHDE